MESNTTLNHSNSSLFMRALRGETTERPPAWMMRQAGRYMEEYRALKEQHSFLKLCLTPELACQVTMQPIKEFEPDAAIIFSDIMIPTKALGFEFEFNPGPKVFNPIDQVEDFSRVKSSNPMDTFKPVADAIRITKEALRNFRPEDPIPLIGFSGTPWTLACYLIAQRNYKEFARTKIIAKSETERFKNFLNQLSDTIIDYLNEQLLAGADCVQLFDSWGGTLNADDYEEFSLPYIQKIIAGVKGDVILFVNGASHLLPQIKQSNAQCIGVDAKTELANIEDYKSSKANSKRSIQGNLDSTSLFGSKERLIKDLDKVLASTDPYKGYIFNLGHGILPATPVGNVRTVFDHIKSLKKNR